jgi:tetratricopeptide (TPR) repeat protein
MKDTVLDLQKCTMDSASGGADSNIVENKGGGDADDDREEWIVQRDENKRLGDDAYRSRQFAVAIEHYTAALSLDPTNGVLLSNRSAAYLQQGYKSAALHDAVACVATNTTGVKGLSRQGAALQALGRYRAALVVWQSILKDEATHAAAITGRDACEQAIQRENQKKQQEEDLEQRKETTALDTAENSPAEEQVEKEADDLDDFFNDVEDAAVAVVQEKLAAAVEPEEAATDAVRNHKRDLGSAADQIARLIPNQNYVWYNLNPFTVLDVPHTADKEEISRRFKALSLLLHPDKNTLSDLPQDKLQLAYDQVLNAKAALLNDDDKLKHTRDLVEQGMRQGIIDWQSATATNANPGPKEEYQRKSVQRLFAELEHTRRKVAERERSFQQREQATEDAVAEKERNERTFDKQWKKEERVDKRIGDWRDFQKKKKKVE